MRHTLVTIVTAAAALALLILVGGCGTQASSGTSSLSQEKYASIEVGMSTDALKSIAGEPVKTEAKNMSGGHSMAGGSMTGGSMNMEYWYYQGNKGWVRLEIADDKVTAKSGY